MTDNKEEKTKLITGEIVGDTSDKLAVEAIPVAESLPGEDIVPVQEDAANIDEHVEVVGRNETSDTPEAADSAMSKEDEEAQKTAKQIEDFEKALLDQAQEGEKKGSSNFTLTKIIAGDILSSQILRDNIGLFFLIVFIVIIYITNRYTAQKYLIEIDKLNTELEDAKYRALASSSQLTEKTRESHILELLQNNKDSVLKVSDRPPYIINVPE